MADKGGQHGVLSIDSTTAATPLVQSYDTTGTSVGRQMDSGRAFLVKMAILREVIGRHAHSQRSATKTVLLILGTATGIAVLVYKLVFKKDYKYPPGPYALPCVGNLPTIGTRNVYLKIQALCNYYGDALTIWMGIKPVVIINSPEVAREALVHCVFNEVPGKPYTWKVPENPAKPVTQKLQAAILEVLHSIGENASADYLCGKRSDAVLRAAFHEFKKQVAKHKVHQHQDIFRKITLMIYSFLHKIFFRTCVSEKDQFFTESLEFHSDLRKNFSNGGPVAVLPWNPINYRYNDQNTKKLNHVSAFYQQYFKKEYEHQRNGYTNDNIRHLTDDLILQWNKVRDEGRYSDVMSHISDDHFIHMIGDIFYAASDTARILLTNIIGYMCAYTEVQNKMHEEIDSVLEKDVEMTFETHRNLPYMEAVIKEVSRMASIKPLVEYETTLDTHIGEYFIPKNTSVCVNLWGIHNNPKYFPSPDKFLPERWLDQHGKIVHHPADIEHTMCHRFCLGELLTKLEVYGLTGMIFKDFRFKAARDQQVPPPCDEILGTLEMESLSVIATARRTTEL